MPSTTVVPLAGSPKAAGQRPENNARTESPSLPSTLGPPADQQAATATIRPQTPRSVGSSPEASPEALSSPDPLFHDATATQRVHADEEHAVPSAAASARRENTARSAGHGTTARQSVKAKRSRIAEAVDATSAPHKNAHPPTEPEADAAEQPVRTEADDEVLDGKHIRTTLTPTR